MQEQTDKIIAIKQDRDDLNSMMVEMVVKDEETLIASSDMRNKIKARMRRIEELRKEAIRPYQDQVKSYNAVFKSEHEQFEAMLYVVDGKITHYMEVQEEKKRREQEKLEEAKRKAEEKARLEAEKLRAQAEKADEATKEKLIEEAEEKENEVQLQHVPVEEAQSTVRTESGTLSRKKMWTYEITDEEELLQTHPELFSPDPKKIKEFVMGIKEERTDAGIRIFQKSILNSR